MLTWKKVVASLVGAFSTTFLLGTVFIFLATPGCKKKPLPGKDSAINKAKAEYNCADVSLEEKNGQYYRLDVCGTERWYRCKKST